MGQNAKNVYFWLFGVCVWGASMIRLDLFCFPDILSPISMTMSNKETIWFTKPHLRFGFVNETFVWGHKTSYWAVALFIIWLIPIYFMIFGVQWMLIVANNTNKAIRDGKYLAPPHASAFYFDIFFGRHFTARSSFYIINWYGYPRGSHEKYLKEIVSPVFEIRYWIVTC